MMTEDEAKTRWCPFVRVTASPEEWHTNRPTFAEVHNKGFDLCIGSACMAFRWHPDAEVKQENLFLDEQDVGLAEGAWWDGRYWKRGNGCGDDDRLHRLVAIRAFGAIPAGMFVDHIDGDARNNRRGNLRIVTMAQNAANAASRGGASQYRGVFKARNKWAAQIAKGGVRMCLGTFETEEEAAAAYDAAAKNVHGEYARLNLERRENSGRRGFCGLAGRP